MFIKKLTKQVICNPDNPLAHTSDGVLRGLIVDDTYIFRGIRYAAAKRFGMPEPVSPWEGVKDAIIYGPVCPELQTVQPDDNYTVPHVFYPQDEDCQYLNVWTQSLDPAKKRPVMVWLHGGGFSTGSGIEHFAYDGENLSREGDVVVVTLNHRLNILGHFDLSAYGDKYRYSANVGLADLVEALRWVQRNIGAFGGDPENVTIFGQSGGGGKVCALLQIPSADGLFHRAVIQSGVIPERPGRKHDNSMVEKVIDGLGIDREHIEELESVPYWKFQKLIAGMGPRAGMAFGPCRDDDFYMGSIFDVGPTEHAKTVPVMVGNVRGEFMQNYVRTTDDGQKNRWSAEKAESIVREKFGDAADEAIRLMKQAYPQYPLQDILFTDSMFRPGTFDYLQARAKAGCENTWGFMFGMEMPVYSGTLPWHNAEIPYVFRNADYIEPSYIPGVTEPMQDLVSSAWTAFAKYGTPNEEGLPEWKPYTKDGHWMMYFDREPRAKNADAEEKLIRFLLDHPIEMTHVRRQKQPVLFGGGPRV
ncbi:MAG: carboxylesterase/lipase family protein [Lachnospiraceae bacterium]|nr:carboxylesterase/lipase family protein [Lachnospiraceae bacterium]